MRRRKKPDLLMVLFVVIGLGVVVTGYAFDLGNNTRPTPTSSSTLD